MTAHVTAHELVAHLAGPAAAADAVGGAAIRRALRAHPIVHLRGVSLDPDMLLGLAAQLGAVVRSTRTAIVKPGYPDILQVGNVRDGSGVRRAGSPIDYGWHADQSYQLDAPDVTLLYAVEVPESGGDTLFSSLERAYDRLCPERRQRWASLRVEHRQPVDTTLCCTRPLVSHHPDRDRLVLGASPGYAARVLGVPDAESEQILRQLAEALEPPDYVHRWRAGDLLAWDNRAVAHCATAHDDAARRLLWRVAVRLGASRRELRSSPVRNAEEDRRS